MAKKKVVRKTIKAVARNLTKAVQKKKVKKMAGEAVAVLDAPEAVAKAFKDKKYKVLYEKNGREVRIYPPAKRTILYNGGYGTDSHFLQMPYMVLARVPYGSGGTAYLFGCFATEDLSEIPEDKRGEITIFRMPFPAQLDRGAWGPCCLSGSPWYVVNKDLDGLIERFWLTSFRALGDYGQKCVTCWHDMSVEDVFKMLQKSTAIYRGTYSQFIKAVDRGASEDY